MKNYFCIFCFYLSLSIRSLNAFNCHLPFGCRLEKIYPRDQIEYNEKGTEKISGIICDVKNENFTFKFPEPTPIITNHSCYMNGDLKETKRYQKLIIRWVSNEIGILERQFNFTNALRYFSYFKNPIVLFI